MTTQTFERESVLVEHSLDPVSRHFWDEGRELRIKREVGVGRNIADVVALLSSGEATAPVEPLSIVESAVLAVLRQRGPTRIDILESRCGVDRGELRDGRLDRLSGWGSLEFGRGGRVSVSDGWLQDCLIIAIEAKLTKWKDALRQAIEYRRYADESYVLLPEIHARPALKSQNEFEAEGIGLLILRGSSVDCIFPAARSVGHSWRREFVYSRLAPLMPVSDGY